MRETNLLRAAFRDLHGARLHGFALLVTLGDLERATPVAVEILEHGARRAAELRHPERAAAWLRARLVRRLGGGWRLGAAPPEPERRAVLRQLGAADLLFDGLAALPIKQRAALVASAVERFDPGDVETIVGLRPGSGPRVVGRARERYLAAVSGAVPAHALGAAPGGLLGDRIREVAGRTMGEAVAGDAR
jgi:DNA-directed RNA polymerase specialized sigma24 family protein